MAPEHIEMIHGAHNGTNTAKMVEHRNIFVS